jgi:hypothetical protein
MKHQQAQRQVPRSGEMTDTDTLRLLRMDVQQGVLTVLERAAAVWAAHERFNGAMQDGSHTHTLAGVNAMRIAVADLQAALDVLGDDAMMAAAAHIPVQLQPDGDEWVAAREALRHCGAGENDGTNN